LPDNTTVPFPSSSSLASEYSIPIATVDLNIKQDCSSIVDEASFESICELRIDTNIVAKQTTKGVVESWPGASDSQAAEKMNGCAAAPIVEPFAVSWNDTTSESKGVLQSSSVKNEQRDASPAMGKKFASSPKAQSGSEGDEKPGGAAASASSDSTKHPLGNAAYRS
uniref:COP1-interacting protein 7 n=1 Tax=Toxocara canis TaxID=6265 RepID=A0A183VG10_TOXCA